MEAPPEIFNWRVYFLAACASMGSAMFGYDSAFIGGSLVLPAFKERFGLNEQAGSVLASLKANIVSTFQAGCFFGAILCYYSTERWGRKWTLIMCGVIFNLGAILQLASSGTLGLIYAGRAFTGLGVGASSLIVPVYIAECSPTAIRGRLIGIFEVMLQLFQVVGFWINYAVSLHEPDDQDRQWQIPFGFQLAPGTLLVLAMLFQPESPRWLIKAGRREEALKVLSRIRNVPESHPYLAWEVQNVENQIAHELELRSPDRRGGILGMFQEMASAENRSRILLGVAIMLLQNLVGANAINYYSPSIFASLGITGTRVSLLATGIYGIVKVIATSIFIGLIIDRSGRRKPLLIGAAGIFVAMMYLGIFTKVSGSFRGTAARDAGAYIAIVMIYFFAICFCMSWNSVAWIFCAEIFPITIRSVCLVITTCAQWLGQFIVVYSTPYMMTNITYGTFFFFAAAAFVGFWFSWFLLPETSGLSLEDMDLMFAVKGSARHKRREVERILALRSEQPHLDGIAEDVREKMHGVHDHVEHSEV